VRNARVSRAGFRPSVRDNCTAVSSAPKAVRKTTVGSVIKRGLLITFGTGAAVIGYALYEDRAKPIDRELVCVKPTVPEKTGQETLAELPRWKLILKLWWRCVQLAYTLGPFAGWVLCNQWLGMGRLFSREGMLELMVSSLARCGPVGIKWGQWASTRFDLFEDDFCMALDKLTNHAPVHDIVHTKDTIHRSLGQSVEELFSEFNEEPLASGSIGQVHIGKLADDDRVVAIKVQHPDLPVRLAMDMLILMKVSDWAAAWAPGMRIRETVNQFASNFEMQLDFLDEARNLQIFTSNFGASFWRSSVTFPQPILASHDVLVETFERGESVGRFLDSNGTPDTTGTEWVREANGNWVLKGMVKNADTILRTNVAFLGLQSYLKMLIWDNFIHADLHPGNVLIRTEEISLLARLQRWLVIGDSSSCVAHIVLLDAGLAAKFNDEIFSDVHNFFDAINKFDGRRLGTSILGLSPTQPYVKSREAFIQEVIAKMEVQTGEYAEGGGDSAANMRSYVASCRNHNVVLDPTVMVALMSMLVLDGWQARLDPSVCIMDGVKFATGGGIMGMLLSLNAFMEKYITRKPEIDSTHLEKASAATELSA